MNHKGLVTFDRKTKKDSFYLYKAFWSEKPFVYIAGKRMRERTGAHTKIKIFTNQPHVKLYNNGKVVGEKNADRVVTFEMPLSDINQLEVRAGNVKDQTVLMRTARSNPEYRLKKEKNRQKSNWV